MDRRDKGFINLSLLHVIRLAVHLQTCGKASTPAPKQGWGNLFKSSYSLLLGSFFLFFLALNVFYVVQGMLHKNKR